MKQQIDTITSSSSQVPPFLHTGENNCSDNCFTETGGKMTSGDVLPMLDIELTGCSCSSTLKFVNKTPGSSTFGSGWSLSAFSRCSFSFFSDPSQPCKPCLSSMGTYFSVSGPTLSCVNLSTVCCPNPAAFSCTTDCRCILTSRSSSSSSSWRGSRPLEPLLVTSSLKTASALLKWCRHKYSKIILIVSDIFQPPRSWQQDNAVGVEAKASASLNPTFDVPAWCTQGSCPFAPETSEPPHTPPGKKLCLQLYTHCKLRPSPYFPPRAHPNSCNPSVPKLQQPSPKHALLGTSEAPPLL